MSGSYSQIYDQHGNTIRTVHVDAIDGLVTFHAEQEVGGILRQVEIDREVDDPRSEFRLGFRVPREVVAQAMREGWFHDNAAWRRWANENPAFKVYRGRL